MPIGKRKGSSPSASVDSESQPPIKQQKTKQVNFRKPSKHCNECNNTYTSERSHKTVCTRKEVSCFYPEIASESERRGGQHIVLHRVDGYFECLRCKRRIKKDQNMKSHARQCYGATVGHAVKVGLEADESDDPICTWLSSDDIEPHPSPPCPVEMPAVQRPDPSTSHVSHDVTLSLTASESAVPLSEPLSSPRDSDLTTAPALIKSIAEPTSRSSKFENSASDDKGTIRIACDRLASSSSCVNCWCNGLQHYSHRLADCPLKPINLGNENWRKWLSILRLPIGCCFYCGCPQKMTYIAHSGQNLRLHDHVGDQSCPWVMVFKPTAFIVRVFQTPILIKSLSLSSYGTGMGLDIMGDVEYANWLCKYDKKGDLNLLNVLLHICELRGIP